MSFRSNNGPIDIPEIETVYAGAVGVFGLPGQSIQPAINAEIHTQAFFDDVDELTSAEYNFGSDFMYLEYGVSTIFCTDHDNNRGAIEEFPGGSAVGFEHDVRFSGTVFLQFVGQCHDDFEGDSSVGDGAYWKGETWYPPRGYPTAPEADILLDMSFQTSCLLPFAAFPPASEYGCGQGDLG